MQRRFLYFGIVFLFFLNQPGFSIPDLETDEIPFMVVSHGSNPAPGYIFTAIKTGNYSHLFAFDSEGVPVFYRKFPHFIDNVQAWPDGIISYFDFNARAFILLDNKQEIMDTIKMKNGYATDFHDFLRLPSGNTILMGLDQKFFDMSGLVEGGRSDAVLIGLVIQEIDSSGELVFEWKCWDHINFTDSYADLSAQYIDYIHPNSFWADSDSTLIISSRNTSELIKIHRREGHIIWRMGGKNDEFTRLGDPKGFAGQHAVSRLANGNLLLFDNSIDLENDPWLAKPPINGKSGNTAADDQDSRGVEYEMSESSKTISLHREFYHDPPYQATNMGSIQRLGNGHTLFSWGSASIQAGMSISEYDTHGDLAFEAGIQSRTAQFYKVYKHDFYTELFTLSEDSIAFGEVYAGESGSAELKIHNPGNEDIIINTILNDHPAFTVAPPLPAVIKPGMDYILNIGFQPTGQGFHEEVLTLCSDTVNSRIAQQVYLSGSGKYHTGTDEYGYQNLTIYPNPSEGHLLVSGLNSGDRIRIYNLFGELIYEDLALSHQFHLDLGHISRGIYIIQAESCRTYTKTGRIILQ